MFGAGQQQNQSLFAGGGASGFGGNPQVFGAQGFGTVSSGFGQPQQTSNGGLFGGGLGGGQL